MPRALASPVHPRTSERATCEARSAFSVRMLVTRRSTPRSSRQGTKGSGALNRKRSRV